MGHGGFNDLFAITLLAAGVVSSYYPSYFFEDLGPFKGLAPSRANGAESLMVVQGSILMALGFTVSTVRWNRLNGTMAFMGLVAASSVMALTTFQSDDGQFVPRLSYAIAAVLFITGVQVRFFSNDAPPKTPNTKNNHGNTSDIVFMGLAVIGVQQMFFPGFAGVGPVSASFGSGVHVEALTRVCGGLWLCLAFIFSGVKWNRINGKMSGFMCFLGVYSIFNEFFFTVDNGTFVPRTIYGALAFLFLGAGHIMFFPSNEFVKIEKAKKAN